MFENFGDIVHGIIHGLDDGSKFDENCNLNN